MNNKQDGLPTQQAVDTGLESLEHAPGLGGAAAPSRPTTPIPTKRPSRPWKKQALLLMIVLLFVGGLGFAALRLNNKIQKNASNQDLASSYKPVSNTVLGSESLIPVQSLNDKTVTINGDLTVSGKLNLSAQALNDLAGILGNTVRLSPALGGPAQAGNINIAGAIQASNFQGNGSNLSELNASSITSGTLNNERLDASVTKLGQTIPLSALQSTILSSLNGISNNGAASIVGSGSVSISTDVGTGTITVNGATGGLSEIVAGTGLTGGGSIGSVTLNVDTGVVTMQGNTFNGANQLVKLGSAGELPVINATNLTNLNASNIASGTVNDSRLSSNVTVQGNIFNGNSQLVKLNNAGELPALSATNLTNLNASNIGTGTLSDARLGGNVTLQGNTFNLANKLVQLDSSGNLPALNGSAITSLNASNIASGTVNDSRLSANVALLNANQTFSGNVTFSQPLSVNVIQPSAAMTIGATNQALTLQGDLTSKLTGTGGTGTVSLGFTGTPVGNIVYQLDASAPAGTYTLCTTVGNCAGSGDGVTSLGGATNKLAKFTGSQAIGDSSISDDGLLVTVGANALYKAGADSTTAFRVQNAAGSTNVFTVDSTNTRVAIGQSSANYTLDVNGDINSATGLRVGGNLVCDANGCSASGSSGFYIQNGATTQTSANFNIESTSTSTPTAVLKLKTSQTADLLQAKDASNNVIAKIDANGNISTTGQFQVSGTQISSTNLSNDANLAKLNGAQIFSAANLFRNASDSTTAFRIQNAAASNLFVADTSNARIAIGQATAGYTLDVNGDINITTGSSYRINGVAICGPTATCAPSSGSSSYVQNGLTVQTANVNMQSSSSSAVVAVLQGATGQTADILQARDASNSVVAKITSSGAIYQGTNQVCDTSNNCNYAVGSGSGNYIQNGTTTQTANMNIQSTSTTQPTAVIQGAGAQTANILEVKDGTGQASNIFSVNQTTSNLIVNPSFDLNTSGWTAAGAATLSRSKADSYSGESSMLITTTAAANDGAVYNYALAASTTYTFSMYARAIGAQWGYLQMYFTNNGSTAANCANNLVAVTGGWTRYTCTFTVVASPSGTRYVGIRQTDATARSFYVDAVQLEASSSATSYSPGAIALNGRINSPVAIQGQNNSTTAFTVQNAAGTALLNVDSLTSMVKVGTNVGSSNYSFYTTDAARLQNVIVGGADGASTLRGASGSGGTINLQNTASQSFAFTSYANTTATNVFQFNATPSSVENLMQIQRNGTAVATFGNTGALQLKNSTDSGNAFQIQNAAGAVALNVSTAVNSTTAWAPTTNFSQARIGQGTVTNNGYMYILGGSGRNDVQYAKFNSDGSLGGWITTSSFTTGRSYPAAVAYNGYMYIMGGDSSGGVKLNDVQYAQINADGSLGSWTTTSSFTTGRQGLTGAVYNGYIYILGGETPTKLADTQYAVINPNGTIGSWTATTNLPNAKSYFGSFVSNGYVYAIGGSGTSTNTEVAYAPLNGNGTIGTWATTTPLTTGRYSHGTTVANGRVYVLGGYNGGNLGDVLSAPLNGNGTVGSWTAGVSFSGARYGLTAASNNGYLYIAGGQLPSNSVTNDVQFLSLSAQSVSNSLSFNGSFNSTGPASFQNGTNSINAFSVQDASATSIFQVDTSNGRVGIMNSSPGNLLSVGALTTADPDGVLAVGTGAVGKKGIVIQAVAGQTADLLQAQDSTGVVLAKLDKDGNLTVKSITVAGHIITSGPVPNMSVIGSIAGSSPTSTNYGTDVAGLIVLTTDSDATGGGDFIRIDFANAYASLPIVVLSPSSEAAAEVTGTKAVYAVADTDGFTISVGAGGLDPSKLYGWSYHVIQ